MNSDEEQRPPQSGLVAGGGAEMGGDVAPRAWGAEVFDECGDRTVGIVDVEARVPVAAVV